MSVYRLTLADVLERQQLRAIRRRHQRDLEHMQACADMLAALAERPPVPAPRPSSD